MPPDYHTAQENAKKYYDAAIHLRKVTFPLVNDYKLLWGVIHNLVNSVNYSMDAILAYERQLQLVPAYKDDFESKFAVFRYRSARRNNISGEFIALIAELKQILELQQRTPLQFQRGNRLILCERNYELKTISIRDIDEFLEKSRQFMELARQIIRIQPQ